MLNLIGQSINILGQVISTPEISKDVKDTANIFLRELVLALKEEYIKETELFNSQRSNIVKPTFV